jgi:hypothetical protein
MISTEKSYFSRFSKPWRGSHKFPGRWFVRKIWENQLLELLTLVVEQSLSCSVLASSGGVILLKRPVLSLVDGTNRVLFAC